MSFDYFDGNANDPFGEPSSQSTKKRGRKRSQGITSGKSAPWYLLVLGLALSAATVVWQFVFPPQGISVIPGNVLLWFLSLVSFLVPLAFFTVIDLKRQLSLEYGSNRDFVQTLRISFVVFGLLASLVQVYALATALSKALNAA